MIENIHSPEAAWNQNWRRHREATSAARAQTALGGVGRSLRIECRRHVFVAHRDEILRQSQQVFQLVLREPGFGERLVAGERPQAGRHVFASVQSLANRVDELDADAFDVVIVDEFHHAAAASYERLLSRLQPRALLGLTATPERADGKSVLEWFDGRIAYESRL